MSQFDIDHYTILMNYNGNGLTQEHLVNLNGSKSKNVSMYFTTNGDGTVKVQNPTNAIGLFPIEQFGSFIETLRQFMENKGAYVNIDERSSTISVGIKGTLP